MTLRNVRIGVSCGALALAACSSTTLSGNPSDGGALDGARTSTGGSEPGGGGHAGSSGGASSGGAGAGGVSSGGGTDAGNPGSGGRNGADAAIGDGDDGGDAGGASDGGARAKRVFVTRGKWTGDLKTAGHGASGIESANRLCQTAAAALGGSWIAWVSDSKSNVLDRIRDVGPWYRLDGVKVFDDKAALTGTPLVPINVNESGGSIGLVLPWTGTFGEGIKDPGDLNINCADWTDDTDVSLDGGTLGGLCGTTGVQATVGDHWTSNSFSTCASERNLFCFEQ
jgi:hypothetical protein